MDDGLHLYVDDALGDYGWDEKPWYLPGKRMAGFLEAMAAAELLDRTVRAQAPPATDAELALFHSPEHIRSVRERCAWNTGALDDIAAPIFREALQLLRLLERGPATRATLTEAVTLEHMPFENYLTYLTGEGLLEADEAEVRLTDAAPMWLADPKRRLNGPTFARERVERAATQVVGAVLDATRRILAGELKRAFLPLAGYHHAHRDEARLYCLYNDPAIAIVAALEQVEGTIAYIDIDIHQGDGVYEGFAEEPRVVIADLHQDWSTMFPYSVETPGTVAIPGRRSDTGRGAGAGTVLNLPLEPDTTDAAYLELWAEAEAFVRAAKPAFVVFEAGVDGLASDPTSSQQLTIDALVEVTRRVRALADELAGGRLLVLGGGGYDPATVGAAWTAIARELL
jgi:acetoin utilization protein AcuC